MSLVKRRFGFEATILAYVDERALADTCVGLDQLGNNSIKNIIVFNKLQVLFF